MGDIEDYFIIRAAAARKVRNGNLLQVRVRT